MSGFGGFNNSNSTANNINNVSGEVLRIVEIVIDWNWQKKWDKLGPSGLASAMPVCRWEGCNYWLVDASWTTAT